MNSANGSIATVLALVAGASAAGSSIATHRNARIVVGRNVRVSRAYSTWMHSEMRVAADPRDARKLVACSIMGSSQQRSIKDERDILYSSNDAGRTWVPRLSVTGASDPACAYTSLGTALFIATGIDGRRPSSRIYRSPDGGASWERARAMPPGDRPPLLDHPTVTTALSAGKTAVWLAGQDLRGVGTHGSCFGSIPLVALRSLDDGTSFAASQTLANEPRGYCIAEVEGAAAFSGGATVYGITEVRQPILDSPNAPNAPNGRLRFALVHAGTVSILGGPSVYSNLTAYWTTPEAAMAIDPSRGAYRNRLYVAWPDWRTGRSEVLFSYSDDRGATWATPRAVDDDRAFGEGRFGPDDFQVMLAVNKDGVVGVAWYSRAESGDDLGWTVRFRASLDGGTTWLPSVRVSSAANTVNLKDWTNNVSAVSLGNTLYVTPGYHAFQFFTGGDYSAMAADSAGAFHPVWSDDRTGVSQMWTARVRVDGVVHEPPRSATAAHYPVPAAAQMPPVPSYEPAFRGIRTAGTPVVAGLSGTRYDARSATFSFRVRLKNASSAPERGPWRLYVESVQSSYGQAVVTRADNGRSGAGAQWIFHGVRGEVLRPHDLTAPRRVYIRLLHERPFSVADFWVPVRLPLDLASIRYRVIRAPHPVSAGRAVLRAARSVR
jgi:hypothetical protein